MKLDVAQSNNVLVNKSARSQRWLLRNIPEWDIEDTVRNTGLRDLTARSLLARGVKSDDALSYLEPKLRSLLPNPSVVTDMDKAASRVAEAVASNEIIGIIADFDVDGITSLTLMRNFLLMVGNDPVLHVPCRLEEGYGPSSMAIKKMKEAGVNLLLTLDCGTTAGAILSEASELGMDVLVIDHHQTDSVDKSISALVNPNRPDDTSGLSHLAACGVVFVFLVALRRELISHPEAKNLIHGNVSLANTAENVNLMDFLDLVALGTMCDVVPLHGLNRAFVRQGIEVMRKRPRAGIKALMDVSRVKFPINARHLSFSIGPRINAAGRLGEVQTAINIFDEYAGVDYQRLALRLNELNYHRQKLESAIVINATQMVMPQIEAGRKIICIADDSWHRGVLGLVAGRIKTRYNRPTLAVTFVEGVSNGFNSADFEGVGSARGFPSNQNRAASNINVGAMIRQAVEEGVLVSGGGHFAAAGFRVLRSKWQDLCAFVEEYAEKNLAAELEIENIWMDSVIDGAIPDHDAILELNQLGPFGSENEVPLFFMPDQHVIEHSTFGDGHIRCSLHGFGGVSRAVSFRAFENNISHLLRSGERVHIAASLDTSSYGPQVNIIDVAPRV